MTILSYIYDSIPVDKRLKILVYEKDIKQQFVIICILTAQVMEVAIKILIDLLDVLFLK